MSQLKKLMSQNRLIQGFDLCSEISHLPGRRGTQSPSAALEVLSAWGSRRSLMPGWGAWACRGSACCCRGRDPDPKNSYTPAPQPPPGLCTPGHRSHWTLTARCHASFSSTHSDPCIRPERDNASTSDKRSKSASALPPHWFTEDILNRMTHKWWFSSDSDMVMAQRQTTGSFLFCLPE